MSYDAWKQTVPEDREPITRRHDDARPPARRPPSLGWCYACIYNEDGPQLTAATTTRHVPVGNYEVCRSLCPDCAEAHDNACERQGLARYEG
jgi:hypothetical protein